MINKKMNGLHQKAQIVKGSSWMPNIVIIQIVYILERGPLVHTQGKGARPSPPTKSSHFLPPEIPAARRPKNREKKARFSVTWDSVLFPRAGWHFAFDSQLHNNASNNGRDIKEAHGAVSSTHCSQELVPSPLQWNSLPTSIRTRTSGTVSWALWIICHASS